MLRKKLGKEPTKPPTTTITTNPATLMASKPVAGNISIDR